VLARTLLADLPDVVARAKAVERLTWLVIAEARTPVYLASELGDLTSPQ
jgi:hypothetical protein